jgi:prepilin-type N-terminal cleavage/methylation domain-containing protein
MSHLLFAKSPNSANRAGLTLLELVVVLGILAMLSTVAVRSLAPIADQARFEQTQAVLNDLRLAIAAVSDRKSAGATQPTSCYIHDTGGLPGSLDDLLVLPSGIINRTVQTFDSDRDLTNDVTLTSGWNGPYLALGAGSTAIVDGWGAAPTLIPSAGALSLLSLGSDGDSLAPEDGYRQDLTVTLQSADYSGTLIFRVFAIDSLSGLRIDPSLIGLNKLAVLFYGVNSTGGIDGSVAEQTLLITAASSFEYRRTNTTCGSVAARAVLWQDSDLDNNLDIGETIEAKSYVHYLNVLPRVDTRIEMEVR